MTNAKLFLYALAAAIVLLCTSCAQETPDIWRIDFRAQPIYFAKGCDPQTIDAVPEAGDSRWKLFEQSQGETKKSPTIRNSGLKGLPRRHFMSPLWGKDQEFTILIPFELGLPEMADLFTDPKSLPGVHLSGIGDNWEIFLNGYLVRSEVHLDENGKIESHRAYRSVQFPVNPAFLQFGTNTIAFRIIGDPNYTSTGLFYADGYYMSFYDTVIRHSNESFVLALCGVYIIMGLYHLVLFFLRRTWPYLFYGIFSILLGVYYFFGISLVYALIPDTNITMRIEYGSLFLIPALLLSFLYRLDNRKPFLFAQIFWGICLASTSMLVLFSPQFAEDYLVMYLVLAAFFVAIIFGYDIIFSFFRKYYRVWKGYSQTEGKRVTLLRVFTDAIIKTPLGNFIVGIVVLAVTVISDSISTVLFMTKGNASLFGSFVFASIVLLVLARRYGELTDEAMQAKAALEDTVKKLEVQTIAANEASHSKSAFLASMSHEIRTPMNAIIGMSELIRTDNFDAMQKTYFTDIRKMARSLLGLINDILDISKIEAGKMELTPTHFDLGEMFDTLCSSHNFTAAAKSLLFKSGITDDLPRAVYGDELRIRQIINNLVGNGVKYTERGFVSLHLSRERDPQRGTDMLVIAVADSGLGIHKEDLPKLFGTFERFDTKKNRGVVGTGLGLAIVKNIVDLMGGTVGAESEYGKGSTFTVRIPLVEGDAGRIEREEVFPRIMARNDARVLVVDDNSINLAVALGFLAKHNIQADTAFSGNEAIEKVKAASYDLVFMDHMMPVMDGTEATRLIRALPDRRFKTMPIVALSANAVTGAHELFIESGMNDFLPKPINADEMNRMLRRWLPPEKILGENRGSISENSTILHDDGLAPLFAELETIPELDVTAGLSHIGENRQAYGEVLKQLCAEFDGYLEEIRDFAADQDWKEYSIRLHGMKGVFANIGVESLREWAYRLEMASKNGDAATCLAETEGICDAMSLFIGKLRGTSL
jgi:signal transduction histidine kinase/HPt (histidine-containing phosphotransfer) domain-containing protein/ActR/RegA family two-component response regulator